jgi:putative SOS response-associated peptidase YedK
MCGRINIIDSPGMQQLLRDLGIDLQLPVGVNVAPTETVGIVRQIPGTASEQRELQQARWWLTPAWAKQVDQKYAMFNARSETLASSRAFRRPFASQRGILPVSSFIEWRLEQGVRQPWLVTTENGALALAVLWDEWQGPAEQALLSCTVVTTEAPAVFQPWHSRMPVILEPDERARWLDNSQAIASSDTVFSSELKAPWLLVPLDRSVGNSRNKDAGLMAGLERPTRLVA